MPTKFTINSQQTEIEVLCFSASLPDVSERCICLGQIPGDYFKDGIFEQPIRQKFCHVLTYVTMCLK